MIITYNDLRSIKYMPYHSIVLATGTFDLFHYEHLNFLRQAKEQGDALVVAVKNDKCAKLKNPDRPIILESQRIEIVDSIKYVDYTVLVSYNENIGDFWECENIQQRQWVGMFEIVFNLLSPDIFFYENNPLLQSAREQMLKKYGGEGIPKERGEGASTSEIIDRIVSTRKKRKDVS